MDLRADLPRISSPTLAIAGADDRHSPPHLGLIADSVQDGHLLVVPGSAHLANDEQPEIILRPSSSTSASPRPAT